jgi:hypothetical protein|tara:strand:- start:3759 stop:4142 length:384 start_codon:yes stop_codon:yes gene_type:complete
MQTEKYESVLRMINAFNAIDENEEVAKVLAINDAVEYGVAQWVMWTPMDVVNSFMDFTAEGSQRLADMIAAGDPMVQTMMQAGVYPEGEFSLKNAAFTMRESFLDTLEAMIYYFDIHDKCKQFYYKK